MNASPDRLIVGCGYLGSRVAARWRDEGSRVYAITRTAARAADLASRGLPLDADAAAAEPVPLSFFFFLLLLLLHQLSRRAQ